MKKSYFKPEMTVKHFNVTNSIMNGSGYAFAADAGINYTLNDIDAADINGTFTLNR